MGSEWDGIVSESEIVLREKNLKNRDTRTNLSKPAPEDLAGLTLYSYMSFNFRPLNGQTL